MVSVTCPFPAIPVGAAGVPGGVEVKAVPVTVLLPPV